MNASDQKSCSKIDCCAIDLESLKSKNHAQFLEIEKLQRELEANRIELLQWRQAVGFEVQNKLREVTNYIGGVIGYRLDLDAEQTERLIRVIENGKSDASFLSKMERGHE